MRKLPAILLAALFANFAIADTLTTKDGSVINGTLGAISDGSVTITTPFAGDITVARDQVSGMTSDADRYYKLKSGNTLFGKLSQQGNQRQIITPDGAMAVNDGAIAASWGAGEDSPDLAAVKAAQVAPREWKYELGINIDGRTGNSEKTAFGGSLNAVLAGPDDTLQFFASGKRARDNGVLTEKELKGGVDYEQKIRDQWSWYTRLGLEYDAVELLDLRTTAAVGLGYQVFDGPDHALRLRTGLQYKHESYSDGRSESAPGLDAGLNHMIKLGPATLATDVTYTPAFEDFNRFNLLHTTSLDWPLSEAWSLRTGVEHDYNSQPSPGTERLDTTYFMRAVLKWQ